MSWGKVGLFAGGVAAALIVQAAGKSKKVRDAAVNGLAACMVANDNLQAGAQSIVDDASDLRAEAERERKIDAAQIRKHPTAMEAVGCFCLDLVPEVRFELTRHEDIGF